MSTESISLRAATATTSTPSPPRPGAGGMTCQSRIARSSGIGMWSWAAKRTAVSSSEASSISGRRSVRTATRWLAIPIRTSRGSFWLVNMSLRASPRTAGSCTSPSRIAPEGSAATS